MGTDITLFIEYCDSAVVDGGFLEPWSDPECTSQPEGLLIRKDYLFLGAIHGCRNKTGIPPLYPLRGIPDNMSIHPEMYFRDECYEAPGWLYLDEIYKALEHQNISIDDISFQAQIHLGTMAYIDAQLGPRCSRMIFDLS